MFKAEGFSLGMLSHIVCTLVLVGILFEFLIILSFRVNMERRLIRMEKIQKEKTERDSVSKPFQIPSDSDRSKDKFIIKTVQQDGQISERNNKTKKTIFPTSESKKIIAKSQAKQKDFTKKSVRNRIPSKEDKQVGFGAYFLMRYVCFSVALVTL